MLPDGSLSCGLRAGTCTARCRWNSRSCRNSGSWISEATAFWGPIPPDLGDLDHLELLNLHGNRLTARIPRELGRLSELRHLALGWNRLSGPVPPELSELNSSRAARPRWKSTERRYPDGTRAVVGTQGFGPRPQRIWEARFRRSWVSWTIWCGLKSGAINSMEAFLPAFGSLGRGRGHRPLRQPVERSHPVTAWRVEAPFGVEPVGQPADRVDSRGTRRPLQSAGPPPVRKRSHGLDPSRVGKARRPGHTESGGE